MGVARSIGVALCCALGTGLATAQRVLNVSAPSAFREPLEKVAKRFETAKPDTKIRFVEVGSETADLVIAGGAKPRSQVSARLFAQDRLVIVASPEDDRIQKFAHLGLNLKIAMPDAKSPTAEAAVEVMEAAAKSYGKDWMANVRRNMSVRVESSSEVIGAVAKGDADAGIVLHSEAKQSDAKIRIVPIAAEYAATTDYWLVIPSKTRHPALAELFCEMSMTKAAQTELQGAGFVSPLRLVDELVVDKGNSTLRLFFSMLKSMPQETVAVQEAGAARRVQGASIKSILGDAQGKTVRFVGADGTAVTVPLSSIRSKGGVISRSPDGDHRVVLPGVNSKNWVRWLRRIEVR